MDTEDSPVSAATLDFLRGFAALYVVVNHTRGAFFKGGRAWIEEAGAAGLTLGQKISLALLQTTSLGTEFVILFFCLSGMAMAHSLRRAPRALRFYARRAIRIWPPYLSAILFALLICSVFTWINPGNPLSRACADDLCDGVSLTKMAFYLTAHTTLTPQFWSLPYEVLFYLLCPFLLASVTTIRWAFVGSILLTLIGWVFLGLELNPTTSVVVNFAVNSLFWFMTGVVGYHSFSRIPRLGKGALSGVALALLLFVLLVKLQFGFSNGISSLAMVVLTLLLVRNLPQALVSIPQTNWGSFSYSIYIFHYAIIQAIAFVLLEFYGVRAKEIDHPFVWIVLVPPNLLLCWLLSRITERPCNAYLVRLRAAARSGAH